MLSVKTQIEMRWCEILNNEEGVFDTSHQALIDLKNLQEGYYKGILDTVSTVRSGSLSTNLGLWAKVSSIVHQTMSESIIAETKDGEVKGFVLKSPLAVLKRDEYESFLTTLRSDLKFLSYVDTINVAMFVVAGIASRIRDKKKDISDRNFEELIKGGSVEIARFQSMALQLELEKYDEERSRGASGEMLSLAQEMTSMAKSSKSEIDVIIADARGRLSAIKEEVDQFQSYSARAETSVLNAIKEQEEISRKAKEEIEGIAASTVARANLAALGTMWEGIATRSKRSMWIFGVIAVGMMIAGIIFLVCGKDFIMRSMMNRLPVDDTTVPSVLISLQLSRIVVMTIPLILYLWGLKIAVRMFTRSMALYDDATQRKTILDSYFFLGEKGKIDKDAQPIVIGAVCRPVPGHGSDGFELPDVAQMLQAGKNYFKS